mmetsp:Transcript_11896/g.27737  ORF Transcript_11896/g.27737 Transcript_11896/m.27737 type:complete len:88 (-) Transcript_11896:93-356(-)
MYTFTGSMANGANTRRLVDAGALIFAPGDHFRLTAAVHKEAATLAFANLLALENQARSSQGFPLWDLCKETEMSSLIALGLCGLTIQ